MKRKYLSKMVHFVNGTIKKCYQNRKRIEIVFIDNNVTRLEELINGLIELQQTIEIGNQSGFVKNHNLEVDLPVDRPAVLRDIFLYKIDEDETTDNARLLHTQYVIQLSCAVNLLENLEKQRELYENKRPSIQDVINIVIRYIDNNHTVTHDGMNDIKELIQHITKNIQGQEDDYDYTTLLQNMKQHLPNLPEDTIKEVLFKALSILFVVLTIITANNVKYFSTSADTFWKKGKEFGTSRLPKVCDEYLRTLQLIPK